jgi:hypothetical protein
LTRTGWETPPCLEPKYEPIAESGAEMMNQSRMMTSIVPKGTAPDDPAEMRKRFRRNTIAKMRLS